jgi:hypothetical protein
MRRQEVQNQCRSGPKLVSNGRFAVQNRTQPPPLCEPEIAYVSPFGWQKPRSQTVWSRYILDTVAPVAA